MANTHKSSSNIVSLKACVSLFASEVLCRVQPGQCTFLGGGYASCITTGSTIWIDFSDNDWQWLKPEARAKM